MKRAFGLIALLSILFIASTPRVSYILLETLETLASDTFEGRQPGTPGGEKAVDYLVQKLESLGIQGLGRGGHKQAFTIFTKMEKVGENFLQVEGEKSPKFQPLSMSMTGDLKDKELVFVGYGISIPKNDPKLKYDDYEGLDVKGKVVVVMSGDPAIGNPDSKFRDPDYVSYRTLFYKAKNAATQGAAGLVYVQDPLSLTRSEEDPFFDEREGGGDRIDVVAGQVRIDFIDQYLGEKSLKELQVEIRDNQSPSSFELKKKVSLSVRLEKKTGRVNNVLAYLPGTDEELKKEIIVIGAHMDHLGYGGPSSLGDRRIRAIHNGADDNASGTALVMDLLNELKDKNLKRSVIAVFFNAEEMGLLGSAHFVSSWARYEGTYGKIKAMLNFDMVGRFKKTVQVMATDSAKEWEDVLKNITPVDEHPFELTKQSVGSSDHASFAGAEIPVLFFTTGGHDDYHRPTDDSHYIDYNSIQKTVYYARDLIQFMDENDSAVTFNPDFSMGRGSGRERGYGAHLGCVPKFGQGDDIVGVLCTGTSPGSPAESAGILAGDILKKVGEVEMKNIYDLVFALKYYRPGDKVVLKWLRGETLMEKEVTLIKKGGNKSVHPGCHFPLSHEL